MGNVSLRIEAFVSKILNERCRNPKWFLSLDLGVETYLFLNPFSFLPYQLIINKGKGHYNGFPNNQGFFSLLFGKKIHTSMDMEGRYFSFTFWAQRSCPYKSLHKFLVVRYVENRIEEMFHSLKDSFHNTNKGHIVNCDGLEETTDED